MEQFITDEQGAFDPTEIARMRELGIAVVRPPETQKIQYHSSTTRSETYRSLRARGITHSPRLFNPWDEREVRDSINMRACTTQQ